MEYSWIFPILYGIISYLWGINHLLSGLLYIPIVWPFHQLVADPGYVIFRLGWERLHLRKLLWWVAAWGLRLARCWRPFGTGSAWQENGRSCFPACGVWFFLKRTLSFSYKLSNVYQVFLGLFGRMPYSLPKIGQALQRPMQDIYIYWYHFYWVEAVSNLIVLHNISRLSHTVVICLMQCCAGIVTAVEILYLNMKPLDHHSPGFSIWSSDIFWSCAKLHPFPVPRSYQASDCSAFVTHFSFSVVGAIRTLLAGDGNLFFGIPPSDFVG